MSFQENSLGADLFSKQASTQVKLLPHDKALVLVGTTCLNRSSLTLTPYKEKISASEVLGFLVSEALPLVTTQFNSRSTYALFFDLRTTYGCSSTEEDSF